MKFLYVLLTIASVRAFAAEECKSVWIFKPYAACQKVENGPDRRTGQLVASPAGGHREVRGGGHNQTEFCNIMIAETIAGLKNARPGFIFEDRNRRSSDSSKNDFGTPVYTYRCDYDIYAFSPLPTGPACGPDNSAKFSHHVGGSSKDLAGVAQCLSCDNLEYQNEIVACLTGVRDNLEAIRSDVPLRDTDTKAILATIESLMRVEAQVPTMKFTDKRNILELKETLTK